MTSPIVAELCLCGRARLPIANRLRR